MRKKQIAGIFITGIILLSRCARSSTEPGTVQSADETRTAENDPTNESMETGENSEKTTSFEIDTSDMFSDSDRNVEYNEAESTIIQLSDEGSFCDTDTVVIDQNTVTITDEGTYLLSGSLSDGMLIVNAETTDEVHLVFNQAAISNQDSAAEHGIEGKDSVRIAEGTYEILSGKDGIHSENDEDETLGFIYLKDGIFKIQSQGDGISAGNWLLAENGTYEITTGQGGVSAEEKNSLEQHKQEEQEKSAKGIKAGAQMLLKEGTYCLDTEDDSIHSNGDVFITGGDYTLSSRDDGIHADDGAAISGGSIKISESCEGIEGLTIDITGGQIDITASDDGVNAAGGRDGSSMEKGQDPFVSMEGAYISISGGSLRINASGDGISSLDYNGKAVVTGGIFASSGASGMAQNFDPSSTQGIIMVTLNPQEAGTQIALKNSDGTELLSWKAEKEYSSVLISSPDIRQGERYSLTAGTEEKTITMDSLVYGTDIPENGKAPVGSEIPKGGRGPENSEVPTGGRAPMEREPAENGKRPGEMDNKPGMGEKPDNENKKEIQ